MKCGQGLATEEMTECPGCGVMTFEVVPCFGCSSKTAPPVSLEAVMLELYGQEQNISISSFFDRGWKVGIGDETNGFIEEGWFGRDQLGEAVDFLRSVAAGGAK